MSSLHRLSKSREALTEWKVVEHLALPKEFPVRWVTLLRLWPHTGRTHQIRVHLADEGYPVFGDRVYTRRGLTSWIQRIPWLDPLVGFPRQALHAQRLKFAHPRQGQEVEFVAPWFSDMVDLLAGLRGCSAAEPEGG